MVLLALSFYVYVKRLRRNCNYETDTRLLNMS
jgi:hypothetical protein